MAASFQGSNPLKTDRTRLTDLPLLFISRKGTIIRTLRFTIPLVALALFLIHFTIEAGDSTGTVAPSPQGKKIAHIYFNGNHVTKENTIRCYLRIDTGMVYDSNSIRMAKKRIMRMGLFSKTEILSVAKEYGCDMYVIVKEKGYLSIPLPGIYQYSRKYGQAEQWFFGDAGVDLNNFGGRMERLRVTLRAWEWRTLGVSWTKPVLPTPYFFGIGVYGDQRPDEFFPFDRTDFSGRLSFGADLYTYSRISFNVSPMFRRAAWHDNPKPTDFYQAYGSIGWSTDRRETQFDPSKGWYLGLDTRSNYLYFKGNTPYVQQTGAFAFYYPGFFSTDKFACRFVTTIRDKNAGYLNRLGIGGDGSVRGYGRNELGLKLPEIPNNYILISAEYRFTLYTLFPIPVPFSSLISPFIGSHKTLTPRIDAALIVDYGRIAPHISDLASHDGDRYESGTGIGVGLRITEPLLQMTGCLDLVFGHKPSKEIFDFYPYRGIHAYTSLPF